eukprot:gene7645-801_t
MALTRNLLGSLIFVCALISGSDASRQLLQDSDAPLTTEEYKGDPELKAILDKVAVNNEVLAAVSNSALITPDGKFGMLRLWIDGCRHANVTNFMVIAIDDQVAKTMADLGVAYWRKDPTATADKHQSNHGISAMKFQLIKSASGKLVQSSTRQNMVMLTDTADKHQSNHGISAMKFQLIKVATADKHQSDHGISAMKFQLIKSAAGKLVQSSTRQNMVMLTDTADKHQSNHGISAMKFQLIKSAAGKLVQSSTRQNMVMLTDTADKHQSNHGISAMKFQLIKSASGKLVQSSTRQNMVMLTDTADKHQSNHGISAMKFQLIKSNHGSSAMRFQLIKVSESAAGKLVQSSTRQNMGMLTDTADKHQSNHGISAMKFQLIKEFLVLNTAVLLSDVDILTLQNPFEHLYRDQDVESLSDGFDPQTAYEKLVDDMILNAQQKAKMVWSPLSNRKTSLPTCFTPHSGSVLYPVPLAASTIDLNGGTGALLEVLETFFFSDEYPSSNITLAHKRHPPPSTRTTTPKLDPLPPQTLTLADLHPYPSGGGVLPGHRAREVDPRGDSGDPPHTKPHKGRGDGRAHAGLGPQEAHPGGPKRKQRDPGQRLIQGVSRPDTLHSQPSTVHPYPHNGHPPKTEDRGPTPGPHRHRPTPDPGTGAAADEKNTPLSPGRGRVSRTHRHVRIWPSSARGCWDPSSDDYHSSNITIRIMNIYDFVNSKTLFRTMRYESRFENHMPVMVHVNYHPDKFARMQSVWARYVEKDMHALDKYPIGSEH